MAGQLLDGRYELAKALSSGSFGKTYLARDTKRPGNPLCVVKQLQPAKSDPQILPVARRLFNTEAETLEQLGTHSEIPQLFAYFEWNGEFYLVQEYMAGHLLSEELLPAKPLSEEQVFQILSELLEVLEFVHRHNVIHRDICPRNIIRRERDNKLVLIDFGAVKQITAQTNPTIIIGTHGYMPVEQALGNPRLSSDIYAVGMLAIQALTGISPVKLPKDTQTLEILWRDKAQVSRGLANILDKMVRHDWKERYPSAKEALQALEAWKGRGSAVGMQPFAVGSALPFRLEKSAVIGVLAVGILAAAGFMLLNNKKQSPVQLRLSGELVRGALTTSDSTHFDPLGNNSYADFYVFEGHGGEKVTIEMRSEVFDPFLILRDPQGKDMAFNDDESPVDFNARIVAKLPVDGTYTVIARSKETGETGDYTLRAVGN
ncbi:protein kinase domain-containing protein [Kamptonema formosum]|uniref:protein kinase domain-containing protein n=1 Tax=Kamptonema formosum TaxID=331992 RepID=UPI0009E3897C|nr:protein kinase [Oscillatoria sp. PCC 10802]